MGLWYSVAKAEAPQSTVATPKFRVVLVGPAAAGKDYASRVLQNECGYTAGVSVTTRPPRDNETNGVDYYFVTDSQYDTLVETGKLYESVSHGAYRYGLTHTEWNNADVFIMNPKGIRHVVEAGDRADCLVIFLNIAAEVRTERLIAERNWIAQQVTDQLRVDGDAFADFTNFDIIVIDPEFDIVSIVRNLA